MKKKLFPLLFVFVLINNSYSQQISLPDSIKIALSKDTSVVDYEYEELYHKNGLKESEGWNFISHYNPRTNGQWFDYLIKHRIGLWKFYRKDGSLRSTEFLPHKDTDELTINNYDKEGNLKMKRFMIPTENKRANSSLGKDNYTGITILNRLSVIRYFKNGQIERTYSQVGLRNIGDYIIYYQSGQMESKKTYNMDFKLDGTYKTWTEEGQLLIEGKYKNGKKVGVWKWYDKTGKLKKEKNIL